MNGFQEWIVEDLRDRVVPHGEGVSIFSHKGSFRRRKTKIIACQKSYYYNYCLGKKHPKILVSLVGKIYI